MAVTPVARAYLLKAVLRACEELGPEADDVGITNSAAYKLAEMCAALEALASLKPEEVTIQ